jgi:adenylate cyclase
MTTRRLAAILAADVVGFSALMECDEEGTFARIGVLRREVIEPRLSEHQGRLIKTTGDGFLVEFASPLAALRCALAVQANLTKEPDALRLRIGLNLGDVIIEDSGDVCRSYRAGAHSDRSWQQGTGSCGATRSATLAPTALAQ